MAGYDDQLSKSFELSIKKYNDTTEQIARSLVETVKKSSPQFERLENCLSSYPAP